MARVVYAHLVEKLDEIPVIDLVFAIAIFAEATDNSRNLRMSEDFRHGPEIAMCKSAINQRGDPHEKEIEKLVHQLKALGVDVLHHNYQMIVFENRVVVEKIGTDSIGSVRVFD